MTEPANSLVALSEALAEAVATAGASIVTVNARRRFPASGVVWSADGVIVTADHVLERDDDISVGLPGGSEAPATIVGRDAGSDVAVLRTTAAGLAPITRGGEVKVGHLVLAVGGTVAGEPMASLAVVSAVGGPWRTMRGTEVGGFIRSGTTFYPGFSGGPLIDAAGQMVGLNSSRLGRGSGMTIPVAALARIVDALLKQGRVRRGFLGVGSQPVRLSEALQQRLGGQERGLLVSGVEPGGPADQAGVLIGDILVVMAGHKLTDTGDLQALLGPDSVGQAMPLTVLRGGEPKELTVTPGERA